MFRQVIAIIRGVEVPWKLFRQDLFYGCVWITIRPVWLVCDLVTTGPEPTVQAWLHLPTTNHTGRIVIHTHPPYRSCLNSFQGTTTPLMMAITCRNMLGKIEKCINRILLLSRRILLVILLRHYKILGPAIKLMDYSLVPYITLSQNLFVRSVSWMVNIFSPCYQIYVVS
jgi:hypothetical protein